MTDDTFDIVKIAKKIEGVSSINVYQGSDGTWFGDILFVAVGSNNPDRCYPDMRFRHDNQSRPWFEWSISKRFYPNLSDDERLDVLTVKMALFLLECYTIDKATKVARQLNKIARPHFNHRKVT